MNNYWEQIQKYNIEHFGFDTQARVLGIDKKYAKQYWNEATGNRPKRIPRTELTFKDRPELSTEKKKMYELVLDDDYLVFHLTPTSFILVPNGFLTDKGSIPMLFQNLISKDDPELTIAYLFHDVECDMQRIPRFETDNLIYAVGTEMKSPWLEKNIVYTAVRAGNRYGEGNYIINGFNVTEYNRELVKKVESDLLSSGKIEEFHNLTK